ncbi:MAG TPA: fibronectin type III domain-containing protein, partial [Verrucomicrobiae bacterium]|nr:fibronectin type III domain-containing protein [Verrucomicrobiae bacterium]
MQSTRMTLAIGLVSLSCVAANALWVQSLRHNGTAYFLFESSPRLERYSLESGQWLTPIGLPSVYGAPTAFHIDADGLYVAYGKSVKRYSQAGSNETHLLNTADPVHGIFSDGGILLLNHTSGLYARFTSLNKANNALIAEFENYIDSVYGAAIAPSINKVFGRSQGISPPDITYVSYNDDGTFVTGGDSPHHGDYPGATRVWVFPGDTKVVDDSGTVYSTANLTFLNGMGGALDDLDFYGADIPVVLRGNTLVAYSNSLLPVGSRVLTFTPKKIYISGTNVMAFTPDAASANGLRADAVPLATLNPPMPGQPVDPHGLRYTPDNAFLDRDGILYLLSKSQQSLFRWDTANQRYLVTIPLVAVPSFAAYSSDNHRIYVAYPSGLIRQIDLAGKPLLETPFASVPDVPLGLATAGPLVFAVDPSGAWVSHYTFSPAGVLLSSREWNYYSTEYIWSQPNQRMYFFRDDTSPNDVLSELIDANGTLAMPIDSPLHGDAGFVHPVRVAPDGSIVVLGSGAMHDATTLARLPTNLANSVDDLAWAGGQLRTIRTLDNGMQFQQWNGVTFGQGLVRQVPGTADHLFSLNGDSLLAIAILDGKPTFYITDGDFDLLPPPALEAPSGVRLLLVSASEVKVTWDDVSGEESYAIERKIGAGGSWSEIATTTLGATEYSDRSVSAGTVYSYRIRARNGALVSAPSAEVSASLVAPDVPADLATVALSSSSIRVTWADVEYETGYLLERRLGSSGSWAALPALSADTTDFSDTGLWPNTTYAYRLRATNGVGSSAYSSTSSATTEAEPPTRPDLFSVVATGPFSVWLNWSDSSYEDNYVLERRTATTGPWAYLATVSRDVTFYTDNTVVELTTYEYRLYATNVAGASDYSNTGSVTTPPIPPPPPPQNLSARPLSVSTVLITWDDGNLETGYRLERRGENPEAWTLLATLPANTTSYVDTNLVEGTQYFYRVQAFNNMGNSDYSDEVSTAPAHIVNLLEDDFDPAINSFIWSSISGAVATNGGQGFRGSQALWFGGRGLRSATSIAVDVSGGGYLEFRIRAGNEAIDGNNFWNNSEPDEEVVLEYSTDGGNQWWWLEMLNTAYPSLAGWETISLTLPSEACTTQTRLRWRQLAHSGQGLDTWALEDVRLEGIAPAPPAAPPFIISSPNSSTAIAVFWIQAERALYYVLERRQAAGAWLPLATLPSFANYYLDESVLPATAYSY